MAQPPCPRMAEGAASSCCKLDRASTSLGPRGWWGPSKLAKCLGMKLPHTTAALCSSNNQPDQSLLWERATGYTFEAWIWLLQKDKKPKQIKQQPPSSSEDSSQNFSQVLGRELLKSQAEITQRLLTPCSRIKRGPEVLRQLLFRGSWVRFSETPLAPATQLLPVSQTGRSSRAWSQSQQT